MTSARKTPNACKLARRPASNRIDLQSTSSDDWPRSIVMQGMAHTGEMGKLAAAGQAGSADNVIKQGVVTTAVWALSLNDGQCIDSSAPCRPRIDMRDNISRPPTSPWWDENNSKLVFIARPSPATSTSSSFYYVQQLLLFALLFFVFEMLLFRVLLCEAKNCTVFIFAIALSELHLLPQFLARIYFNKFPIISVFYNLYI